MTTYRVGEHGATVWTSDGRLLGSLPPGVTIVPAVEGVAAPAPTAEPPERIADGRRMRGYDDKAIHPSDREDKGG